MRAAVYTEFAKPLTIMNVADPVPADDGVVIGVRATGLCRSDWHGWMGHDPDPWCEFLSNNIVRFWSAGGISSERRGGHVDCSMQFVSDELANLQPALERIMRQLRNWLLLTDSPNTDKIVDTFGQSFAITTEVPLYQNLD